jgi:hypothetical protein
VADLTQRNAPQGLEIVTVALDAAGTEAVRPWVEAAHPGHPSLIDQAHLLDELLGVVNVPSGVWIDEQGMIVRPPEPAYPRRPTSLRHLDSGRQELVEGELSPQQRRAREVRAEVRKILCWLLGISVPYRFSLERLVVSLSMWYCVNRTFEQEFPKSVQMISSPVLRRELNGVWFRVKHHNLLLSFGRTHGFRPVSGRLATFRRICHTECLSALVGAVSQ